MQGIDWKQEYSRYMASKFCCSLVLLTPLKFLELSYRRLFYQCFPALLEYNYGEEGSSRHVHLKVVHTLVYLQACSKADGFIAHVLLITHSIMHFYYVEREYAFWLQILAFLPSFLPPGNFN